MKDTWIYEDHTDGYGVRWKISNVLHEEKTRYQELSVVETLQWGKALILDGMMQTTEKDEFIYHEMITHIGMNAHPSPQNILIIGGGDGGVAREVLKHPEVETVELVEIDERVIEISKKYFPSISAGYSDKRVKVKVDDGIAYAKNTSKKYDVIIVDSSDPIGPAVGLYTRDFYSDLYDTLNDEGLLVVQSESPIIYKDIFVEIYRNMNAVFNQAFVYLASVPTYVSGPWSFTIGSKKHNPLNLSGDKKALNGLKYYSESVHKAAFVLPVFIQEMIS